MNDQKMNNDMASYMTDYFAPSGGEIKEKRTSSAKVYSLGGGRYQAVLYPEPVHYQNESGEWLEIHSAEMPESGLQAEQANDLVPGSVSSAATAQTGTAMVMNYVSSKRPANTYTAGYNTNIAHNDYTWGKCDTFLRFDTSALPPIDSSYYVTGATLTMKATKANANETVYLKEVLSSWDGATLTYNNRPAVASMPLDFQRALNYEYAVLEYNIANLVRKWYNGENYGLMLETLDGGLVQLGGATASYHKPYITIEYISLAGLEDYLAQETHPCGRAGTASVGLFNGNLIFAHQETAMNGHLLPVSIARYYNSCYHDENPFGAGAGWKFSAQQTLHQETLDSVVHYVYMDGDGTRHYFKNESGAWRDLSGLSLKLELDEEAGTAAIIDKGDNTLMFPLPTAEFNENYDNVKMIQSMADAVGNQASFAWNGRILSSVTDGAGRPTNAAISNGLVSAVTAPGMPPVSYSYANGHLTAITHEDGKQTTYAYNTNGLLCEIENHDGTSLQIAYYNTREPFRVKQVTYLANNQAYAGRFYEYGDCRTTVSEMYPDANGNLVTGKALTYHFNDQGNIVSVNDELGYGCFAGYSADAPTNHPSYVSRMQRAVTNHLKNHHFQRTTDNTWTVDLMDGVGSCLYASDEMFMGGRAYKMNKTSANGRISIHQMTLVPVEQQYTLSCYYKTQGDAAFQLRAEWPGVGGAVQYVESVPVQSEENWDRAILSFTLPEVSGDQLTVRLMACGGAGTVWLDCAQLEDGPVPNRYNMIEDGTFECYADGELLHWTPGEYNTDADRLYSGPSAPRPASLSGNVLRLYGEPNTHKYFQQSFSCIGRANDSFVMGGWSMSYSCPRDDDRPRQYEMLLMARPDPLEYEAGGAFEGKQLQSNGYPHWEEVATLRWSDEWSGWHFAARPVTIPWRYMEVGVRLVYRNNYNFAEFSNIFLHQEEFGSTFTYDENANVISKKGTAALKRRAEYDDHDNPTALYAPGRDVPTRLFWSNQDTEAEKKQHLLRKSISPLGIVSKTVYDLDKADEATPKGLPLEKRVENANASLFIAGKTEYTANKNYTAVQTDARNKTVSTVTDPNLGVVTSVIDPNGQEVKYTYDTLGRTVGVETTVGTGDNAVHYRNAYLRNGDLLVMVGHNTTGDNCDVAYTFEYDDQNRRTAVKVGNQVLSQSIYNDTPGDPLQGTLTKSVFGNGGEIRNTYDAFKRVVGVQYDNDSMDRYQYQYGANGQVVRLIDTHLHRTALSEYDLANRPMRITHMEGDQHLYTGQVGYDDQGNLQTFKEWAGQSRAPYRTDYAYDIESKPTVIGYGLTAAERDDTRITYSYDGLGRTATRTLKLNGTNYAANYTYLPGGHGEGSTTSLISAITQGSGNNAENFTYTYDNVGNISSVTQNGKLTSYAYDPLGQLIRVNDQNDLISGENGTTWTYEYDRGGNILNKKRYAYTVGSLPAAALETVTYAYTDANWKDKLTEFNGSYITYDEIGNPTSDGEWLYSWEKGRQLKAMSKASETVVFEYNASGLRVKKIATSTGTTHYTLHGKQITHLTNGNNTLHFFYDASGKPAMVEWNNGATTAKYAYIHNLQRDIVGIIDSTGAKVVSYTYDAWGKPLSTTGSLAATLGKLNPFRYRGYVYDEETEFYYLRSRFYNAKWGRCLSADVLLAKVGVQYPSNLFTYACNVPIVRADSDGTDSWYIIYDNRPNATEQEPDNKGLKMQGEWAIEELALSGENVQGAGFEDIPGFISAWNNAGINQYDYIIIYAHGSPGTIDCAGGYLQETLNSGKDARGNTCYSSINELKEIRINKGILLLSCNGATPDGEYRTAIGMLSSKAGGVATMGSAYASINYENGTGIPYQTPGISSDNTLWNNLNNILNWLFASCWVTYSYEGLRIN